MNHSKNQEYKVLDEMMLAREYMAKAAYHASKVSESYKTKNSNVSNFIATSSFDLSIFLIDQMNKSTDLIDLFTSELETTKN